tara:strand:+ start:584 stop:868 length:285 start_codon:yes stop_codon:yes gene_type:complete
MDLYSVGIKPNIGFLLVPKDEDILSILRRVPGYHGATFKKEGDFVGEPIEIDGLQAICEGEEILCYIVEMRDGLDERITDVLERAGLRKNSYYG